MRVPRGLLHIVLGRQSSLPRSSKHNRPPELGYFSVALPGLHWLSESAWRFCEQGGVDSFRSKSPFSVYAMDHHWSSLAVRDEALGGYFPLKRSGQHRRFLHGGILDSEHEPGQRQVKVQKEGKNVSFLRLQGTDEGIAVLTLHRPDARNAIGRVLLEELQEVISVVEHDKSVRAILLQSTMEGVFCAGADLKERKGMSPSETAVFVSSLRRTFSRLEGLPMPTIAVVEGVALGGGLEMALACDIRVAGRRAVFALPECALAIIPGAGGTQRLPKIVGLSRAKELIFSARRVGADEAELMRLVDKVADVGQAFSSAMDMAREFLPRGPLAIRLAKMAINAAVAAPGDIGMAMEAACYAQVLASKDRLEGLAAFAEKREPKYTGE